MIKLAILASGKGSNARKLLEKSEQLENISIEVIITDKKNAGVIEVAKSFDIPFHIIEKGNNTKMTHEEKILNICRTFKIDWIFLAGYMRILSHHFLEQFTENGMTRVINIHPSLLPQYKGLNAFERAFADQVTESGITIHFVNPEVDAGDIIAQEKFQRRKHDQLQDFISRGQAIEYKLYPKVLEQLNNKSTITMDK